VSGRTYRNAPAGSERSACSATAPVGTAGLEAVDSAAIGSATPASDAPAGSRCLRRTGSPSAAAAWQAIILQKLDQGLTAQRIYQDLVSDHGYAVRRLIKNLSGVTPMPFRRMKCEPGAEASAACRGRWCRQPSCGGEAGRLVRPRAEPQGSFFCRHYGIAILPTRPYTPRHKGKLERGIGYVKGNAPKGHTSSSLADQNHHLLQCESQIADTSVRGTTRQQVGKLFEQAEKPALLPLPTERFELFHEALRHVNRDGHVQVKGAYYSAPPEFLGQDQLA
jgi:hypothetical protein